MSWDDDAKKSFDDLLAELVDGTLSDERRHLLGEMVGAHREARELYVDFCQLQAQLLEQHGALGAAGKPPVASDTPKPKAFPVGAWLALAAAIVIVGLFAMRDGSPDNGDQPPVASVIPDRGAAVATVSDASGVDFVYGVSGEPVQIGDDFGSGIYELRRGIVELTTSEKVELVVQGPAQFELEADGHVVLSSGRVSATVPESAAGFTVRVGETEFVDLGTQFVVDASMPEFSEVHVFQGSVLVRSANSGEQGNVVSAGTALRVYRDTGLPAGIDLEGDRYLRSLKQTEDAYSELVKTMNPVVYYPMTPSLDGTTLQDASGNGIDGRLSGMDTGSAQWTKGRIGSGLYLAGPSGKDGYALVDDYPKAEDNQISCSAWVYAESLPGGRSGWTTILKNWGLKHKGQFHFGLMPGGVLEVHVNDADNKQKFAKETEPFPLNEWQHVAFVANGSRLRLYRNGEIVAAVRYSAINGDPSVKGLGVGVKPDSDDADAVKRSHWNGRLDEVALFNRALTAEEVEALYEAGRQ
jgi:hypothetical protein